MSTSDRHPIRLHEDPALFRETVRFTAAETGFMARLIEKDYFCTVLLEHLAGVARDLVFKGGTCLAKVHTNFYRLSEDLDFAISTSFQATRGDRTRSAVPLKDAVLSIGAGIPGMRVVQPITGANKSTHYAAVIGYESLVESRDETIEIEVSLPSLSTWVRQPLTPSLV
jgi:hypothetical protein